MKRLKNTSGFGAVEAVLIIVVIGMLGSAGWFVYRARSTANSSYSAATQSTGQQKASEKASQQTALNPAGSSQASGSSAASTSQKPPTAASPPANPSPLPSVSGGNCSSKSPASFDIAAFYNSVQNGMSYNQVCGLAGQSGDCSQTNAYPNPSVSCTWTSGTKSVTVGFGTNDSAAGKSKSGF